MTILIGMDEAGYGPNLGPLVIAATAWQVDSELFRGTRAPAGRPSLESIDLYDLLASNVTRQPASDGRIAIADSKILYQSRGRLARLECGVLAALASLGYRPASWRALIRCTAADSRGAVDSVPWYRGCDLTLPIDPPIPDRAITDGQQGVSVLGLRARAVFVAEFNAQIECHGNKAAALTAMALELLGDLLWDIGFPARSEPIFVVCDKHGGRSHYAPALMRQFPGQRIALYEERRQESRYRLGTDATPLEIRFRMRGEAFLPAALASMMAKYVRELAMQLFNHYWQRQVPGLAPTAGYPADAKRFRNQIATRQRALGIDDRILWRIR